MEEPIIEAFSALKLTPSTLAAFPDRAVLEEVLHDYSRRADRMSWSPYDLVNSEACQELASSERLSPIEFNALKTVLFVEDHLPAYMLTYLKALNDPNLADAQHILNRQVLHFTFRWVSEEDRHAQVLERYLTHTGLIAQTDLELLMVKERKKPYDFPFEDLTTSFVYLALQEKATHLFYKALARSVRDPLLKLVLSRMAGDEASHGRFFYDLVIRSHLGDLDAVTRTISIVANDFKMPVQNNLDDYRRQVVGLMRSAPSYRHDDVFADMARAVDRASRRNDLSSLSLIAPDQADDDE